MNPIPRPRVLRAQLSLHHLFSHSDQRVALVGRYRPEGLHGRRFDVGVLYPMAPTWDTAALKNRMVDEVVGEITALVDEFNRVTLPIPND